MKRKRKLSDEIAERIEYGHVLGPGTWIDEVRALEDGIEETKKSRDKWRGIVLLQWAFPH